MALTPSTLYIALYLRSDPPQPNDFHWALYHTLPNNRGTKYHITNEGADRRWIAGHSTESHAGMLKGFLLVGLIRVAGIHAGSEEGIDTLLRSQDDKLNDLENEGITCRVWLLSMLDLLIQERVVRDVRCGGDIQHLEGDVKDWGNMFSAEAARNVQPRPVGDS